LLAAEDVQSELWTLLLPPAANGKPNVDEIVRKITLLGPDAVPAIISMLLGEAEEPDVAHAVPPLVIEQRSTILSKALAKQPEPLVVAAITKHISADTSVDRKLQIVRLLADVGSLGALDHALTCVVGLEPIQWERAFVRVQIVEALTRFATRDSANLRRIGAAMARTQKRLASILMEALAATRSPAAMPLLMHMLGKDSELDLTVLQQLMEIGGNVMVMPSTAELKRLYAFLDSTDGRLQRAAATLLTRIGDDECCLRLAQLLESEDELTAATAHTSLKSITGQTFEADREPWSTWLEVENAWLLEEFAKAEESIASGLPENVLAGAAACLEHRLYRHRTARALETAFAHDDPVVQKIACDIAAKLASPFAVPSLLQLLESEDETVRTGAWSSLRAITKQDLPLDVKRWQNALGL
jgi:hypothetical protein